LISHLVAQTPSPPVTVSQPVISNGKKTRPTYPSLVWVAACGARAWHGLKRRQLKKNLFSRETHAFFFSCHPRAPAFRALKKSEKTGSNSQRQFMTPGGVGIGMRLGLVCAAKPVTKRGMNPRRPKKKKKKTGREAFSRARARPLAWPETAPTEKKSIFTRDPRVFFFHATHARPPSGP